MLNSFFLLMAPDVWRTLHQYFLPKQWHRGLINLSHFITSFNVLKMIEKVQKLSKTQIWSTTCSPLFWCNLCLNSAAFFVISLVLRSRGNGTSLNDAVSILSCRFWPLVQLLQNSTDSLVSPFALLLPSPVSLSFCFPTCHQLLVKHP